MSYSWKPLSPEASTFSPHTHTTSYANIENLLHIRGKQTIKNTPSTAAKRPAAWNSPLNSSIGCTLKKFAELLISYIIGLNILFYHLTTEFILVSRPNALLFLRLSSFLSFSFSVPQFSFLWNPEVQISLQAKKN